MENEFAELGIEKEVLNQIKELGFERPTRIQNRAIPHILEGTDVVITAPTGSGKTLAYAVRLIQNSQVGKGLQGMVLVPTRELAKQVGAVLKSLTKYKPLNIMISYGGGSLKEQKEKLRNVDILVGTPGRISDYVEQDLFELGYLKTVVLDEGDSMVQNQFLAELEMILKTTPKAKQTLVLSATIPKEIYELIKNRLNSPKRVTLEKENLPKNIKHNYYEIEPDKKLSFLSYLLENERSGLSIVFANRQDTVEFLMKNLKGSSLDVKMFHGEMGQGKRNKIIKDFEAQKFDVLVCTDVIARGLDIAHITHVYNYNIPKHTEKYIHRVGRTARAGAAGKVINLISKADMPNFENTVKEYKFHVNRLDLPEFEDLKVKKAFKAKKHRR